MANPIVLIHAEGDDVHAQAVARCLGELAVAQCVLHREQCFQDWTICCADDEVVVDVAGRGSWTADDVRSVYWRRDFTIEPAWVRWEGVTPETARFLAEQRSLHVNYAVKRLIATTPFVNEVDANRTASSKPLQQHVARRCGLRVPRTYLGSDPVRAEAFARTLWAEGRRCCTKNVESTHVEIGGVKHARLTKLFTDDSLGQLAGLAACPMFFQEYVEKAAEYRVTVVGGEVYACRIESQRAGGKTAVDWRNYNVAATPHYAADLGEAMTGKLVRLVRTLGLTFGAVDLVEDPNGEFWFLEINPQGQWLWIEDLTDLPISMAIARHLAEPSLIHRRHDWHAV